MKTEWVWRVAPGLYTNYFLNGPCDSRSSGPRSCLPGRLRNLSNSQHTPSTIASQTSTSTMALSSASEHMPNALPVSRCLSSRLLLRRGPAISCDCVRANLLIPCCRATACDRVQAPEESDSYQVGGSTPLLGSSFFRKTFNRRPHDSFALQLQAPATSRCTRRALPPMNFTKSSSENPLSSSRAHSPGNSL